MKKAFFVGIIFVLCGVAVFASAAGTSKLGDGACMIDFGTVSSITNSAAQDSYSVCRMFGGHGLLGFKNTGTGVKNVTIQTRVTSNMGSGSMVWTNATGALAITPTNTDSFGYDLDATMYGTEYRLHCLSGCSAVNTISGVLTLTPY